jgi:glucose-6-phosphate isomerase, archaeal
MSLMEPFGIQLDLAAGSGQDLEAPLVRRTSQMRGYYADPAALEAMIAAQGDPKHYETFEYGVPERLGHLKFCISKLYPGLVGEECFMTKGHYHAVLETGELYLCLRGEGGMLMKTREGICRWEEFRPGRLVYAPPCWAHRSINTGDEPLISLCIYPGNAGHNYGDIQTGGFPQRVFNRDGKIEIL